MWLIVSARATGRRGLVRKAVVGLLIVFATALTASSSTAASSPTKRAQTAFLNELATNRSLNFVDYSQVHDRDVVAAGVAFCKRLGRIKGRLDSIDFDSVAQSVKARFTGSVQSMRPNGTPTSNGDVLLAYGVGIAAVHKFCPKHRLALG
jgi:hypothetical protein